ncbi:MAG TPA: tRNA guanosine(34) transglycosylase Tgt [Polyangiaceae bacterium]|nr:tRNA guanosine(34) transglycosylase Tgt [Polyangiaceae bacterium]
MIRFEVMGRSGTARAGCLHTAHGEVPTPAFQPVGTQASVKALSAEDVTRTGARLVIMNTYHLWVRPGPELIAEQGGLHAFSRWPHSITTDSGGFQAFSLAERRRLDEDGFEFRSHLDGRALRLTPEEAMRIQGLLGSDIAMQLDVCPPGGSERAALERAVALTTRWGERCLAAKSPRQALFGIVQGGTDVELRLSHAETLGKLPFDGLALGGFSVGEPIEQMYRTLAEVADALDPKRPRYLMGVGTPADIVRAIGWGIDLFDCVLPTRNARNGQAFVGNGKLVIKNAQYRNDPRPLSEECGCSTCTAGYSRSYLRHLYLAKELLVHSLLSAHNLWFYGSLVARARAAILAGEYAEWARTTLTELEGAATP